MSRALHTRTLPAWVLALVTLGLVVAAPADRAQARPAPINGDGAWTIYMDPKVYSTSRASYVGSVRSNGEVEVVRLAHGTLRMQRALLQAKGLEDDHAAPGIVEAKDGRVAFFWSGHGDRPIHYRVTPTSGSLTGISATRTLRGSGIDRVGATYAQVVRLDGERQPYHLFTRLKADNSWYLTRSADLLTWSPAVRLTTDPYPNPSGATSHYNPYLEVAGTGYRTIHIGVTTGKTTDGRENSLYHFVLRNGALEDGRGRVLRTAAQVSRMGRYAGGGTPPSVVSGTRLTPWADRREVQVFDLSLAGGIPAIATTTLIDGAQSSVAVTTRQGSTWRTHVLTRSAARPQSLSLDQTRPHVAYVGRRPGTSTTELYRWSSPDGIEGWTGTLVQTGAPEIWTPATPTSRAIPALGPQLYWMSGLKPHFTDLRTGIYADVSGRAPVWLGASYLTRTTGATTVTALVTQGLRGPAASKVPVRVRARAPGSSTWRTIMTGTTGSTGRSTLALPRLAKGTRIQVSTDQTAAWGQGIVPSRVVSG